MSRLSKKAQAKSSKSGRAQVNVRTTPELLTQIDRVRQDTSRSEFIVQAIEAYLGIEPASVPTTASLQSLVEAAVAQAIQGVTRTLESRLKVLESRLSGLGVDVDEEVDSVDSVGPVFVDLRVGAPLDSVDDAVEGEEFATSGELGLAEATGGDRNISQESEIGVDAPVDSVDDEVEVEVQATSEDSGLAEATGGDRHGSSESKRSVDQSVDSVDDAVEQEFQATSGASSLKDPTRDDRNGSQESKRSVDQSCDLSTEGLSGRELAKRLSVSPSSLTSNRQKKGTKAFAKWTSQQDPDGLAWNHQKGRYYLSEPNG
ncbi:ribbon-helix-helix domain-containing protein [Laspinema olomoucense]|uniref:ribbon-helix-helix domain-containing protein n=1 Tax=Laspinema olomoucense TaxID=3231600 RepID=UPI0021BA7153|nr:MULTISPECIES: ribbon-helix-helix domain-containing protein [unclassified Laspinema]MCT7975878.1 ribbon-helix-helix domain-containing protein [Laspinema sp. D3d]MCT7996557.1 ribbon-helix-helix domain-containing protein [Laspinema sp. D3c]